MKKLMLVLFVCLISVTTAFAGGTQSQSGGAITLTLWSGYPEMEPFYKQAAEEYAKTHPNVKVEILSNPVREYEQKLSSALPSDTAADILEGSNYNMKKFVAANLLPPLPENVGNFIREPGRYSEFTTTINAWNGKLYGVPFFTGQTALYWNKAMFKEAGLTRAPQNYTEMAEYAKKLSKYDNRGNLIRSGHSLRLSGQGAGIGEKFWFVLYPMGGTILEESKSQPGKYHAGYNNDAGRRALKYYIDAVHVDKWDSFTVKHDAEAFELEQTAMFFRESWVVGDIAQKIPELDYDTAYVPSDARWGRISNPGCLYVSRSSKNAELAWDFVLFLVNEDNQRWMFDKIGWLPCRQDVDYSEIFTKQPQMHAFIDSPAGYQQYGYVPIIEFEEVLAKFSERLATAFLDASLAGNNAGMAKVMSDAAEETNTILRRANLYAD
jgi:multiple sugar transport system substrate-binding protein